MSELVQRGLGTLIPVFAAIFLLGVGIDYFFLDEMWATLVVTIAQFVISYFFAKELAFDVGLLNESERGPGFGAYFGLSFLLGFGIGIGYILLVLPGIFLQIRWLLALPILFSPEGKSGSADRCIGKSWELTGKVFWKLLAAWIMGLILTALSFYAYYSWVIVPGDTMYLVGLVVANAATAASIMYSLVLGFAAYTLLRDDRVELERIFS